MKIRNEVRSIGRENHQADRQRFADWPSQFTCHLSQTARTDSELGCQILVADGWETVKAFH